MEIIDRRETSKLSSRDLLFKYLRFLPLVIFCVALAYFLSWLYLRYTQEQYSSVGTMLISTEDQGKNDKIEDLIAGKNKTANLQNEIEVLNSRPLMIRVVKKLNLQWQYTAKGKVKDMNAYKNAPFECLPVQLNDSSLSFTIEADIINNTQFKLKDKPQPVQFGQLFRNNFGVFKLVKTGNPVPGSQYIIHYNQEDVVAASMLSALTVQPKMANTGILLVQYETTNPYLASDVVNALMKEYTLWKVEQGNTSMDLTIEFVDKRLGLIERDIDSLQRKLVVYQRNNSLVDAGLQTNLMLTTAQQQDILSQEQRMKLGTLDLLEDNLKKSGAQAIPATSLGIADPGLNQLLEKYNDAQLQRKALVDANVPENNPQVKQLDESIENLRKGTLQNVGNLKSSYQKSLGITNSEKSKNTGGALQMPSKVTDQAELERELTSKLALYKVLGEKKEEAAISRASTISNTRVIQKAEPDMTPVKPSPKTVKLAALLIGLAIPGLFILLKEALNDRVNTRGDLERNTQAPILGEIGHSKEDKTLVVSKTRRTLIAEQFRILRSNLQYIIGKKDKVILLVTSSFGGEGKSFISTNMAAVYGLTGKKTIVLEFDLRKPRVLAGLDMQKRQGISNYMIGEADLETLIIPVAGEENLFVLPCGPIPPNPAELLLSERVEQLFAQLKQKFDFIIIDTAPIGMVSDAMTLGRFADCTLYVTRQGHTFKKQINLIEDLYQTKKLPNISLILNDTRFPTGGGYYGNYGYGYGYGYGEKQGNDYYQDEQVSKSTASRLLGVFNPLNWFKRN